MVIKREGIFTYHVSQDRQRKNLSILELIRKKGPISRADISRMLGLNIVSVSNYLDFYINKKMILEVGYDVSSGGRRPELLELNARSAYIVGVDIGPDNMKAVITDLQVNVISSAYAPRPNVSMEDLAGYCIKVIEEAIDKSNLDKTAIKNIGIGTSGIIDYVTGTIHDTDPVRGRSKANLLKFCKAIEGKFYVPVYIGNDASCAAFGEKTLNHTADVENLLYVYSDVGLGIVIQDDVYCGSSGCAGEIQLVFSGLQKDEKSVIKEYTHMRPWGVDLGVVMEAVRAIDKGVSTQILSIVGGDVTKITKEVIIAAAKQRDKLAVELVSNAARNLGVRVAYFVNIFNPDIVVIGGGVEKSGEVFMDAIKETVKKFSFEEPASIVKIIPTFLEDNSVVLGAAALAAREVFIET
ncbi:MAG: ROK family protein [Candidatus Omnitrophota bacterium]|nr:ROK family protein [Candidatus Omnitrophota bacterium]